MSSTQIVIFLAGLADMAVGGLISNGFIVKVILTEWTISRSLAANEQLLLSLSISNFSSTALVTASFIAHYLPGSNLTLQLLSVLHTFVVFFRSWLTAWLSGFYCIKITTSTHFIFLWCKLKISWLIPRLLVGSAVISSFVSIYAFHSVFTPPQSNTTANGTRIQELRLSQLDDSFKVFYVSLGSVCPVTIISFCSILVVVSLCRHICRMTGKESRFKSPQIEAHVKAAGTVISLLLLHILFYVIESFSVTANMKAQDLALVLVVMLIYAPAQAAILVLVNPKLKLAATQILLRKSQDHNGNVICSHI